MRSQTGLWRRWFPALVAMSLFGGQAAFGVAEPGSEKVKEKGNGWLGVAIQQIDRDLMESEKLPSTDGVYVIEVVTDSPADKAGIKKGDVILQFDGQSVNSARSLTRSVERCNPGESKTIVLQRDGAKRTIEVVIGDDSEDGKMARGPELEEGLMPDVPEPDVMSPDLPRAFAFSLGQLSNSRIGVSLYELSDQLADYFGAKNGGALINEVVKDGPADKAGLKAGDVIVQVDHKPVENVADIRQKIQRKEGGERATITVLRRGNEERTVDVTVEESDTWSGVGDNRFFRARPYTAQPLPGDQGPAMRRGQRAFRDSQQDLREEMNKLRKELDALKKELREKGK